MAKKSKEIATTDATDQAPAPEAATTPAPAPKAPEPAQGGFLEFETGAKDAKMRRIEVALINVNSPKDPDDVFVKSIAATGGATEPVIVIEQKSGGRFTLIEGRRRVLAHRILAGGDDGKTFETIGACVYEAGSLTAVEIAVMALRLNHHRSANPIAELTAVNAIERSGVRDSKMIASMLGIHVRQVQRLKRLELLTPELREALADNRMTLDTALKATKLSRAEQEDLSESADESGVISGDAVHGAMEVGPAKGLEKLFSMDLRPTTHSRLSGVIGELHKILADTDDDEIMRRIGSALVALGAEAGV